MRPIHPITGTRLGISPDRVSGGEPVSSPAEFYGGSRTGVETRSISTSIDITGSIVQTSPTEDGSTMSPIGKACRMPTDVSTISSAVRIKGTSRQVGNSSVVAPKPVAQLWLVRRQVLRVVQPRGKRSASVRRSCLREQARPISPEQRPLTERGRAETRKPWSGVPVQSQLRRRCRAVIAAPREERLRAALRNEHVQQLAK